MNPDKRIIIDELLARVNGSPFVIVIDYTAITVPQFTELRQALSDCGSSCHVAKNNFMRQALTEAGLPDIGDQLVGQTAFVTGSSEISVAAKVLNTFIKKTKKGNYKIAIAGDSIMEAAQVAAIGDLPSLDVLRSMLLGTINGAGSALARVIQAYADKDSASAAE